MAPHRFLMTKALLQRKRFHGTWQYLFIESICNDPAVLEQNYRYKMMYSPDYSNVDTQEVCVHVIWLYPSSKFELVVRG